MNVSLCEAGSWRDSLQHLEDADIACRRPFYRLLVEKVVYLLLSGRRCRFGCLPEKLRCLADSQSSMPIWRSSQEAEVSLRLPVVDAILVIHLISLAFGA